MKFATVSALFLIVLTLIGCVKQDGKIAGTVTPAIPGVRVTAQQNGKIVSSIESGATDGRFILQLSAGRYDVSVAAPASSFPVTFAGVEVHAGETTDLSTIAIPSSQQAGKCALSGRITPAPAGTTLALYSEGRERAAAKTDTEGKYIFKEIPSGTYTLEVKAPEYARDSVPVILENDGTATKNMALLYASQIQGVDWAAGKIKVTGIGIPPRNAANNTVRRELAKRAALSDAQRKLIKIVAEIKTGPDTSLRAHLGEKSFSEKIQGFVQGYTIAGERESDDGKIEIDLELPLTGQNGLSRYLAD